MGSLARASSEAWPGSERPPVGGRYGRSESSPEANEMAGGERDLVFGK